MPRKLFLKSTWCVFSSMRKKKRSAPYPLLLFLLIALMLDAYAALVGPLFPGGASGYGYGYSYGYGYGYGYGWGCTLDDFSSAMAVSDDQWCVYDQIDQDYMAATNFAFSIPPSATIDGIQVDVEGHGIDSNATNRMCEVALMKSSITNLSAPQTVVLEMTNDSFVSAGATNDLWGTTLTPADINSAGFGVVIRDADTNAVGALYIDTVRITVSYTLTLPVVLNLPATSITTDSATLNGNLVSTGGAPTTVTIYWGEVDGDTNDGAWANSIFMGTLAASPFATNITGLTSNTMYYYRCFASNSSGIAWAPSTTNFVTASNNLGVGLVAYYPFNGNANDESGSGNHGAVTGAVLSTDRFGVAGTAYIFDGLDDRIDLPRQVLEGLPARTIAGWFKTTASSGTVVSLNQWYAAYPEDYVQFEADGRLRGHYWGGADILLNSPQALNDGRWHNVSLVLSSSEGGSLYVDGLKCDSNPAIPNTPPSSANHHLTLGCENSGNSPFYTVHFDGPLDDIRIYDRALSSNEVKQLYTLGDVDSDSDGLPDWWEQQYFGNLAQTGSGDQDGDGWTNAQEYQNGGNPTMPDSPFPVVNNNGGASGITSNSATLNGIMVNNGGFGTETYIYWGEIDGGVVEGAWQFSEYIGTIWSVGPFYTNVTGLLPGTMYFYRCWASNVNGSAWAPNTESFLTAPGDPNAAYFKAYVAPSPTLTGALNTVTVEAWKGTNIWNNYTGTVTFFSSDASAMLPADYTFQLSDNGTHIFLNSVAFSEFFEQWVKAEDTVDSAMLGYTEDVVVFNGYGTNFEALSMWGYSDPVLTGQWTSVSVAATDVEFRRVTNYTGTISFESSDTIASLPPAGSGSYAFTPADAGWRAFTDDLQYNTIGEHWLKVTDTGNTNIWNQAWDITVMGDGVGTNVDHFVLEGPRWIEVGQWWDLAIVARDVFEHTYTGFLGTVEFMCSDPSAVFPATYTFTTDDEGAHYFLGNAVQFNTPGAHWLRAQWQTDTNIFGAIYNIIVEAPNQGSFAVEFSEKVAIAGQWLTVTVKALDWKGDLDTNFTGTIIFSSSAPGASLPSNYTFIPTDQGAKVFNNAVKFVNGGEEDVFVEKQGDPSRNGDDDIGVYVPGALATTRLLMKITSQSPVLSNMWNDVLILALDDGNRLNTGHTGAVEFVSSDPFASFAVNPVAAFSNGIAWLPNQVLMRTPGDQTLRIQLQSDTNVFDEGNVFVLGGGVYYYVSKDTGNNANDGLSTNSAWQTISKAVSNMGPGDVAIVAPEVYDEAIVMSASGSPGRWIGLYADMEARYFGGNKRHVGTASPGNQSAFTVDACSYIALCGFSFANSSAGTGVVIRNSGNIMVHDFDIKNRDCGILVDNSTDVRLDDTDVASCSVYGIRVTGACDNLFVNEAYGENCNVGISMNASGANILINDSWWAWNYYNGIELTNTPAKILGNWTTFNNANGIRVFPSAAAVELLHNFAYGNTDNGIVIDAVGSVVQHNTVVSNGLNGIVIGGSGCDTRNNISAFNGFGGIYADAAGTNGLMESYNCCYGNTANWAGSASPGVGDISADPLLDENFHLKSQGGRRTDNGWVTDPVHSPCIDAGDPSLPWSEEPMPNGSRANIGAYGNTPEASKSANPDADADGMPDAWEIQYFGGTNVLPGADVDADSMPNMAEYIAGTDPTNNLSLLAFSAAGITNGNPWNGWASVSGRTYSIEYSSNGLATWFVAATNLAATPPFNIYEDPAPYGTSRFYRVLARYDSTNQALCVGLDSFHWLSVTAGAGGSVNGTNNWQLGGAMPSFTATPSNGYHFLKWTGTVMSASNPVTLTVTQSITVVAEFQINTNSITAFAGANGAISPMGAVWLPYGGSTNFVITPNANYHITDLVVDGLPVAITNNYAFSNVTNAHTITALFGIDQFLLSVTSLYDTPIPFGLTTNNWNALINASVNSPVPNGAGTQYVCKGWTGTGSLSTGSGTNTSFNITNNTTLAWNWRTQFMWNVGVLGAGSVSLSSGWYDAGTNLSITATPSNGYYFVNWTGDLISTNNPLNLTMSQAYSVTANFAVNTYDITATAGAGGAISPTGVVLVAYGSNAVFGITPNANYHVSNVVVDSLSIGPTNAYTFNNVTNGAHTIAAVFAPDTYTLNVISPYGTPAPAGSTTNDWNTFISASIIDSPVILGGSTQYVCTGWSGTGSAPFTGLTTNTSFNITNDTTVTWLWKTNYWLDSVAGSNGSVSVASGWFALGTNVVITAAPSNGYYFGNWSGTTSGCVIASNQITVPMTVARSITANFAASMQTITATAGANGNISPSGAVFVAYGGNQTFTITANANYYVLDVVVDGGSIGPSNSYTFANVTTNHGIAASFAVNTYTLSVNSPFGAPAPSGLTTNNWNTLINASVNSPVPNGAGTQYVCKGWTGTGSVPGSGTSNAVSFNITANSTLAWNWATQHMLTASAGANGSVAATSGWYWAGSNVTISASGNPGYHFGGWVGDVPAGSTNNNPLTLTMSQARSVTANFALDLGSVVVTLSPAQAVSAGAQWRLTSGPDTSWHNSGYVAGNLSVTGNPYTVTFSPVAGWTTPVDITGIVVTNGVVTALDGVYLMGSMVLIPGGTFMMGIMNGEGGHQVSLSDFYIDARPVSVSEFQAFCAATSRSMPAAPPWGWTDTTLPMVNVTWNEASAYAAWAGKRLPTEAEYEYVMRSGAADQLYPWGNGINSGNANYNNNVGQPTVAATYPANGYGVFDIAGNVWEWCSDWYESTLLGPVLDPQGPGSGTYKCLRGGSYGSSGMRLMCGGRFSIKADVNYVDVGFRCANSAGVAGGGAVISGDSNKNNTPDWWEQWYFGLTGYDGLKDSDGDGLKNWQEYITGTDPTNWKSLFEIDQSQMQGGGFVIKWSSAAGKLYTIERCSNLVGGFAVLKTNLPALPPMNVYTDTVKYGSYFYRVKVK